MSVQLVVGLVTSDHVGVITAEMSFHLYSASQDTAVLEVIAIGAINGVYAATHTTVDILVIAAEPSIFGSALTVTVQTEVIEAEAVLTTPPAELSQATVVTEVIEAAPSFT